ncbi:MAG TPA: hypothetical protein PLD82_00960 [Spirochaetota bacterium]|nr:hypothetical protein [Spirochaetota bacterium]HPH02169.1 hypothetical protein [Spirochaetota bacterium]
MDSGTKSLVEEKISLLSRQLEMVLRTSGNPDQKKRVSQQLAALKKDRLRLDEGSFGEDDIRRYLGDVSAQQVESDEEEGSEETVGRFPLLSAVMIQPASPECNEQEVNEIASFLRHFEREYLSVLGNYQLKLDFNHAQKRDTFFNLYGAIQHSLKSYLDVVHDISSGRVASGEHADSLRQMKRKLFMDLIMKTSDFTHGLHDFLSLLISDYQNGGNLVLNPEQVLVFDPLHGHRELDGMQIAEGIERIRLFLDEFSEYLNVPGLKKMQNRP